MIISILFSLLVGVASFTGPLTSIIPSSSSSSSSRTTTTSSTTTALSISLKPAAVPLMDSGKAFARSGEFLIEVTSKIDLYGGALSATGALIRNAGDCIAQAAASCRFKTGMELVCDELREGATCLAEATLKLKLAIEEANADQNQNLSKLLGDSLPVMDQLATSLELAGASILRGQPAKDVGLAMLQCSESMESLSVQIRGYAPELQESSDAGQRMAFAAERMRDAGYELTGTKPEIEKPKGKSWIKG